MIRLHVVALTRLTRAALPGMIERGQGAIINMSSILAFSAARPNIEAPGRRAMYAATKAYVNAFTQLVHHELGGTGVRMQALCPGMVLTEFHARMGEAPPAIPPMPADAVVEASLIGLRTGEVICAPPVEDAGLIAEWQEAELRINDYARANQIASRYRGGATS
jgi:short-subunit dehydrogenase